jgi:predicted GTPase
VDPRDYYQGSLKRTLKKYRHIGKTIPAMGYSAEQVQSTYRFRIEAMG